MMCCLYPAQITKSLIPYLEYIFIICQMIGLSPISNIGFGLRWLSSEILVPNPPARMTAFIFSPQSLKNTSLQYIFSSTSSFLAYHSASLNETCNSGITIRRVRVISKSSPLITSTTSSFSKCLYLTFP